MRFGHQESFRRSARGPADSVLSGGVVQGEAKLPSPADGFKLERSAKKDFTERHFGHLADKMDIVKKVLCGRLEVSSGR